jgi:hypothetical protein
VALKLRRASQPRKKQRGAPEDPLRRVRFSQGF